MCNPDYNLFMITDKVTQVHLVFTDNFLSIDVILVFNFNLLFSSSILMKVENKNDFKLDRDYITNDLPTVI